MYDDSAYRLLAKIFAHDIHDPLLPDLVITGVHQVRRDCELNLGRCVQCGKRRQGNTCSSLAKVACCKGKTPELDGIDIDVHVSATLNSSDSVCLESSSCNAACASKDRVSLPSHVHYLSKNGKDFVRCSSCGRTGDASKLERFLDHHSVCAD
eukprot:572414-Amphidinium_carterae.1